MAKGIDLSIAADTRSAMSAINRGIIDPLEDVSDLLEDVERDSQSATDDLEKGMRDAQRRTEDASDEIRKLRDDVNKAGRASRDAGQDAAAGMGRFKEGAQEVTQEVGQNLGQAVSSVRGDMTELGQVGQDTLGGLAATLASSGPAGIAGAAALAAGAVGLGLVTAEIEKQNEKVQRLREYFADAWQQAIEGGKSYIDTATIASQISEIALSEDWAEERERAMKVNQATGLDLSRIYQALAGDMDAVGEVSAALSRSEKEYLQEYLDAASGKVEATVERANASREEREAVQGLSDDIQRVSEAYKTTNELATAGAQAISDYWLEQIDKADSATRAVDDFGNELITLPSGAEIVIDAKTGQATTDLDNFKTDTDEVVKQLDGSEIELVIKTALQNAQNDINRFMSRNNGRTIRLHGRFNVSPSGTDWD